MCTLDPQLSYTEYFEWLQQFAATTEELRARGTMAGYEPFSLVDDEDRSEP